MTRRPRREARLARAGYGVALLLIVFPLLDATMTVWPFRPGMVTWRFGAAGTFSNGLMTPLVGLLILLFIGISADRRALRRSVGILAIVMALSIGALSFLFVLDAIQVRAQVDPIRLEIIDASAAVALLKLILSSLAAWLAAVAAFTADRSRSSERAEQRVAGDSRVSGAY